MGRDMGRWGGRDSEYAGARDMAMDISAKDGGPGSGPQPGGGGGMSKSQLEHTLHNDIDRFPSLLNELKTMDKDKVLAIAKEFMGRSFPSKPKAIEAMQHRYESLMSAKWKARATGGRTAA